MQLFCHRNQIRAPPSCRIHHQEWQECQGKNQIRALLSALTEIQEKHQSNKPTGNINKRIFYCTFLCRTISEQLAAGACWEDRKIWLLSEEEMGSFVMHSSQRHQQTCVERGAASRSRRAPDRGAGGLFLYCAEISTNKGCKVWHRGRTRSSFRPTGASEPPLTCTSQAGSGLKVHTKQLWFKPSHKAHLHTAHFLPRLLLLLLRWFWSRRCDAAVNDSSTN